MMMVHANDEEEGSVLANVHRNPENNSTTPLPTHIESLGSLQLLDDISTMGEESDDYIFEDSSVSERSSTPHSPSVFQISADTHDAAFSREDLSGLLLLVESLQFSPWLSANLRPEVASQINRRLRDFQAVRRKRLSTTTSNPWGMLGLYIFCANLRMDLEWVEEIHLRRITRRPYVQWEDYVQLRKYHSHRPYFIYAFLMVAVGMMIVAMHLNHWRFAPLEENPMVGPSSAVLIRLGALDTSRITIRGEWYRLVSAMTLHAGLVHFFFNSVFFVLVGRVVEQVHGTLFTAFIFLTSGVGGNLVSAVLIPEAVSVGASGAMFGLLGICLADILCHWDLIMIAVNEEAKDEDTVNARQGREVSHFPFFWVVFWLLFDICFNIFVGTTPLVDNFAHLGGFVFGLCIGVPVLLSLRDKIDYLPLRKRGLSRRICNVAWHTVSLCFVLFIVVSCFLTLYRNSDDGGISAVCHQCRFLSCLPFPPWGEKKLWDCTFCNRARGEIFTFTNRDRLAELDLICPRGQIETIDLKEHRPDLSAVMANLPEYCREYCIS